MSDTSSTPGRAASSPARGRLPDDCREETLVVAFFDLSRIGEWSSSEDDAHVAGFFQEFYELAARHVAPAGGRIVKFMGDAGLAVFGEEAAEQGIFAMCDLAAASRALGRELGLDTYLNVNVHVGEVLAGSFGPKGAERYDVIGKTVNIAARLGRRGVTISAQAFRCLGGDARKRFEKRMLPITYRFRS